MPKPKLIKKQTKINLDRSEIKNYLRNKILWRSIKFIDLYLECYQNE